MTAVFYRVHWTECGPFSPENAWSSTMGLDRKPGDASMSECLCTVMDGQPDPDCDTCDGTGWQDCQRGYSCYADPEALLEYFDPRGNQCGAEPAAGETVVIFEGYLSGNGHDGENLAVPERMTETMTWGEFKARYGNGRQCS